MIRSTDRILTSHVGSLVRPPRLRAFLERQRDRQPHDDAEYRECLHESVLDVVHEQAEAGVDIVSDGEFGKTITWAGYVNERLAGLEHRPSEAVAQFPPTTDGRLFPEFWAQYGTSQGIDRTMVTGWVCTGAVSYAGQEALQQDIDNLEAGLEQVGVTAGFLPVVAPASVWGVRWDGGYYATEEEYHICWGSFNAPHMGDVPLRDIVDLVLKVNAGAYAIEMANPRHAHEWRLWEDVTLPEGKILIPGVISHSTNVVEHPELVAERLVRLAKLVGRESLMAGTDCGFAQGPLVQRVHASIQWAKLRSLAEGAELASRELWGGRTVA